MTDDSTLLTWDTLLGSRFHPVPVLDDIISADIVLDSKDTSRSTYFNQLFTSLRSFDAVLSKIPPKVGPMLLAVLQR